MGVSCYAIFHVDRWHASLGSFRSFSILTGVLVSYRFNLVLIVSRYASSSLFCSCFISTFPFLCLSLLPRPQVLSSANSSPSTTSFPYRCWSKGTPVIALIWAFTLSIALLGSTRSDTVRPVIVLTWSTIPLRGWSTTRRVELFRT